MGDYGFIACPRANQDLYFQTQWFTGSPPLREGDKVEFEIREYGSNLQAHHIERAIATTTTLSNPVQVAPTRALPTSERLFDWAYLGYMPEVLETLKRLALNERWEFKNMDSESEWPYPILTSYINNTFGRLVIEGKIYLDRNKSRAAFNTGLVDSRYEPIYAVFEPNLGGRAPWRLSSFCTAGEGRDGQNLVRNFTSLPETAHYFSDASELLYDTKAGSPEFNWYHIVIERIGRYPPDFIEDHWPKGFEHRDPSKMSPDDQKAYYFDLGIAIEQDARVYRQIMNRVRDGIELALKRVKWNYKTAIPTYYPRVKSLQLLLPLCLLTDEQVDVALAVERTASGSYLGHTILPLDWAYKNARLVCRPDSEWLAPGEISTGLSTDED
ncbi:MAG TPA: DUF3825 domain-containing protein [Rhodothermales bacterium]|nr:DUF3825 domain-containing protein [Rhodothermales bacterium]